MDDLSTEADWQCVIRRSSRKSSFVLNLPMVFNGLDVMNNFVEQEKKTGPVYNQRKRKLAMFITAVCILFLIKGRLLARLD